MAQESAEKIFFLEFEMGSIYRQGQKDPLQNL